LFFASDLDTNRPNLSLDAERGDDDHLLHRPVESLDSIRNSATMNGVPGRSNRL
jgi:hypothetical protein